MQWDDTVPEGAVRIPLRAKDGSVRAYTIVDDADAEWVNRWRWYLTTSGYACRTIKQAPGDRRTRALLLHRALSGLTHNDPTNVDHINRIRLDNRRANIRLLPKGCNQQNQPANSMSSSKHRGVSWRPDMNKWVAQLKIGPRTLYLGSFDIETDAAEAALAARRLHLPYAVD